MTARGFIPCLIFASACSTAGPIVMDKDVPHFCGPYTDIHLNESQLLAGTQLELLQPGEGTEGVLQFAEGTRMSHVIVAPIAFEASPLGVPLPPAEAHREKITFSFRSEPYVGSFAGYVYTGRIEGTFSFEGGHANQVTLIAQRCRD